MGDCVFIVAIFDGLVVMFVSVLSRQGEQVDMREAHDQKKIDFGKWRLNSYRFMARLWLYQSAQHCHPHGY